MRLAARPRLRDKRNNAVEKSTLSIDLRHRIAQSARLRAPDDRRPMIARRSVYHYCAWQLRFPVSTISSRPAIRGARNHLPSRQTHFGRNYSQVYSPCCPLFPRGALVDQHPFYIRQDMSSCLSAPHIPFPPLAWRCARGQAVIYDRGVDKGISQSRDFPLRSR